MMHVIERERFNKMTLQNVSIVLSPTMQISHRVLNCLFENSHILFEGVQLKKCVLFTKSKKGFFNLLLFAVLPQQPPLLIGFFC